MGRSALAWLVSCVGAAAGCGDNSAGEDRLGGDTTIDDRSALAFTHPAANLSLADRQRFVAGASPFGFEWQIPELGPQFNNDACAHCHGNNGRGLSLIGSELMPGSQALIRVSLPTGTPAVPGGPVPVPELGLQLHDHATVGLPQVIAHVTWIEQLDRYADGSELTLRSPVLAIRTANNAPLPPAMLVSYRQPPPIIGLGLLEAVAPETLAALAATTGGRVNQVWDVEQQATVVGRFGVKANTSTLHLQTAAAFVNDIGLTSKVFPDASGQRKLADGLLEDTSFMVSVVGVPAAAPRDATAWRGRAVFDQLACARCHVPTLVTGAHPIAALAHQTIHPYTDLLVHDMGDALADGRPDFLAGGREFRTPPLWGVGLAQIVDAGATFLHDGRARTLEEAILWHGGDAADAREAFRTAARADRDALIAFLRTL